MFLRCSWQTQGHGAQLERLDEAHRKGIIKLLIGTDAVFWGSNFHKDHPWYEEHSLISIRIKLSAESNMFLANIFAK